MLAQHPEDADALAVKVYSLILSGKYNDALASLKSSKESGAATSFCKAYCLWKAGKNHDALAELDSISSEEAQHLRALALMRSGQAAEAQAVYAQLLSGGKLSQQATVELVRAFQALQELAIAHIPSFGAILPQAQPASNHKHRHPGHLTTAWWCTGACAITHVSWLLMHHTNPRVR